MANISLREYFKEIDNLIDSGQNALAVDHCKYILSLFPKNFETYRLLGKAYLEEKDFSQAADIFQRAMAIRPDDFIANVGMSCVREEEGNLDAAIWHMERAFEIESSNTTIQSELKRLYGLRDGTPPQKIRLTKGALIRMYVRGDMLQQAMAEIQAKFSVDDDRPDIQVLRANLLFQTGQKASALELCQKIVVKLPYCYDANLILMNSLVALSRNEEAKPNRERLVEIDPYFAYVQQGDQNTSAVDDQAVVIAKYLPTKAMQSMGDENAESPTANIPMVNEAKMPAWFSEESDVLQKIEPDMGSSETAENISPSDTISKNILDNTFNESMPQNLDLSELEASTNNVIPSKDTPEEGPGLQTPGNKDIDADLPDWMKESGWKPEIFQADLTENESLAKKSEDILPADIPEWVQGMAPPAMDSLEKMDASIPETPILSDDLFTDLEKHEIGSIEPSENVLPITQNNVPEETSLPDMNEENNSIPDWLQGFNPTPAKEDEKQEEKDLEKSLPEWLNFEEETNVASQSNPFTMDDLSNPNFNQTVDQTDNEHSGTAPLSPQDLSELDKPEWQKETQPEGDIDSLFAKPDKTIPSENDLSSWIDGLRTETNTTFSEENEKTEDSLPDWLKEPEPTLGDTAPVSLKSQAEESIPDAWIQEHENPVIGEESFSAFQDTQAVTSNVADELPSFEMESLDLTDQDSSFPVSDQTSSESLDVAGTTLPVGTNNIESTIEHYNRLIQSGNNLNTVIEEIKKLSDDFPTEPGIWLVLGDAYHHSNQIQAALDAYSRAEEFLS